MSGILDPRILPFRSSGGQVRKRSEEIKDEVEDDVKHRDGDTKEDVEDILLDYSPDNIESTDQYH
jgi:hypothetical protein